MVTNITRQFGKPSKNSTFADLASLSRADLVERYAKSFADDGSLINDRGDLVRMYREKPQCWPDGIDTALDRWYRPAEWSDDGKFIGTKPIVSEPVIASAIVTEPLPAQDAIVSGDDGLTVQCSQCGNAFVKSGRRKFCSNACKTAAWKAGKPAS